MKGPGKLKYIFWRSKRASNRCQCPKETFSKAEIEMIMGAVEVKKHKRAPEKSRDILGAQTTLSKADAGVGS